MRGRTVLITGGNSGIGLEAAVCLTELGARVVITARDPAKGDRAAREVLERAGTAPTIVPLDLGDLSSVRRCADEVLQSFPSLEVLICNAGLTLSRRAETADGFEYLFGVNHLGHFHLVELLRQRLIESAPARVVVVASDAHRIVRRGFDFDDPQSTRRYRSWQVYGRSKLANILFTRELARRLSATGVTANALHPGLVKTNFGGEGDTRFTQRVVRALPRRLALGPREGAETIVYLASSDEVSGSSGGYYVRCRPVQPSAQARDDASARRLWQLSEDMIRSATGT